MSAINKWLNGLTQAYGNDSDDLFIKRATGWKASGDTCALLFACLEELRGIRQTLEQQRARKIARR